MQCADLFPDVLAEAATEPWVVAHLATAGVLEGLVSQARQLAASGCTEMVRGVDTFSALLHWYILPTVVPSDQPLQAVQMSGMLPSALMTLATEAERAMPAGNQNQQTLQAALQRFNRTMSQHGQLSPEVGLAAVEELLGPVAQLAAQLLAGMGQQHSPAERRLALAHAAATRSCAYLCCAKLGGEGGPAAGEGAGSMRCRWAGVWVADGRAEEHSTERTAAGPAVGLLWAC